ncbi:uncharacterized protein LOC134616396 isoform X2 [Pelmatolapia mariae]|uniref:uncharacterized protein LOC134616396 isoform X2 n=1 Tax=Pelmatolapia mariae TaxID=158779 RepID=UPI002FE53E56
MPSVQSLREFINERLTAAAEQIFLEFEKTIVQYEEEIDRQRRLLDITWKPQIKLHRTALTTPQSSPQPTDSRHHNAPPSFRHLSPLRQNTQNDTASRSPQHAESDVFPIDDSRDSVRPLLQGEMLCLDWRDHTEGVSPLCNGLCHYKRAGLGTQLGREKNKGPDKAKKGI